MVTQGVWQSPKLNLGSPESRALQPSLGEGADFVHEFEGWSVTKSQIKSFLYLASELFKDSPTKPQPG